MESCEAEKNSLSSDNEELKGDVEKKTEELTDYKKTNEEQKEEIKRLEKEIESLKKPVGNI